MNLSRSNVEKRKSIEVFCCYAHEDRLLLLELKAHLAPLEREGFITLWADIAINAGMIWEEEIHRHLNTSRIILLLVSPDFMASKYCYSIEMRRAMERHECGEALVVPIILRHVDWQNTPFGRLQALPPDARPVKSSSWYSSDEAFFHVALGISKAITTLSPKEVPEYSLLKQWLNKGETYRTNLNYGEALAAYERAIQLVPTETAAWVGKGDILYDFGQYEEALAAYERSIQIYGQSRVFMHSMISISYRRGITLFALQHYEEALVVYRQSVDSLINPGGFSNEITDLLLSALDRIIRINPNKAVAHESKGDLLYLTRQYEESLSHFEQAIKLEPSNIDNYCDFPHNLTRFLKHKLAT